jgi:hypothetical protein
MTDADSNNQPNGLQKYQAALQLLQYEQQILWLIFGAFLLPHTVLVGFLLDSFLGGRAEAAWHLGRFSVAVLGLLVSIPWFAAYGRNAAYYFFRMSQAKAAEPDNWHLLKVDGESFADGDQVTIEVRHKVTIDGKEQVTIDGKKHQIPCFSRFFRTRWAIPVLMLFFPVIYLGLAILNGPWWPPPA